MIVIKPYGQTPNELIKELKKKHNLKKMSFIGRLDPMASGVMLLLKNEQCKKQNEILKLMKRDDYFKGYRFKLILGIETLSYDVLSNYIKITNIIDEDSKYNIIILISKYNLIFYNIHEDIIEFTFFTNNIIKFFNGKDNILENNISNN